MFRYKFLDYPKIPREILNNMALGELIREYPSRTCSKNNTTFNTSSGFYYHANTELDAWVRNNIPVDIDFVGIRHQHGSADTPSQGAHTDATRSYGILYIVDNAGGHVDFWQKQNTDVELDRFVLIDNYDELSLLESVATPNGSWYVVNGKIIHSVENMSSTRITVQINLNSLQGLIL